MSSPSTLRFKIGLSSSIRANVAHNESLRNLMVGLFLLGFIEFNPTDRLLWHNEVVKLYLSKGLPGFWS